VPSDIYFLNINIVRQYLGTNSKDIRKQLLFAIDLFHKSTSLPEKALETETLLCPFLLLCHEVLGKSWESYTENYSLLMLLTYYSCDVTIRALTVINELIQEEKSDLFHPSSVQDQAVKLKNEYAELEGFALQLTGNPYFTQDCIINKELPTTAKEISELYALYKQYLETLSRLCLDVNGNLRTSPQYFMRQFYIQNCDDPGHCNQYDFDKLRELIEPITIRQI